ncbi:MAG: two-component system sensor kinase, partial [Prosthecobacter sp.]|nr:two-component system sensor kinase [Prosthecobacter sp.]
MGTITMNFSLPVRRGFLLALVAVLDSQLGLSRMQAFLRYAILIGLWGLVEPAQAAVDPALQTIASVQAGVSRKGEVGLVRVRGAVTYRKEQLGLAFVQDKTGGIAFYPRAIEGGRQAARLDTVEIMGVPLMKDGMLMLCGAGSTDEVPLPPALSFPVGETVEIKPRKIELSRLADLRADAEFVQATGVMRRVVQKTKTGMTVEVSSPGSSVVVRLSWLPPEEEVNKWINRQVAFKGVIVCRAEKRLLPADADAVVFVSQADDWEFQAGVIEKALASAPVKVSELWRAAPLTRTNERVHIQGVVTAIRGIDTIDLHTDDGSVEITSRQAPQFHVGQRLSAACGIINTRGVMRLVDGVCRGLGEAAPVAPRVLKSAAETSKIRYGDLVRFSGIVRDVFRTQDRGRLLVALKEGGTCAVLLEPPATVKTISESGIGSKYEFTGIFESGKDGRPIAEGANFVLHLRSDADVRLMGNGPWWTRQRLTTALWALAIVVGLAVPGAFFLRWKIWRQEQKIRQFERANASAQERKRIAGEFHDSLQQELASASLHLETLAEACLTSPQRLPVLLADLSAMLRHCQIEARN